MTSTWLERRGIMMVEELREKIEKLGFSVSWLEEETERILSIDLGEDGTFVPNDAQIEFEDNGTIYGTWYPEGYSKDKKGVPARIDIAGQQWWIEKEEEEGEV